MNRNFFAILSTRWFKALVAFLIIDGWGVWFVLNEQNIRKEAWDGVITEQWEKKPLWVSGGGGLGSDSKYRRRIKHYWRVQRDDGPLVEVKVPMQLYSSAGPGTRIQKIFSERYPRVVK